MKQKTIAFSTALLLALTLTACGESKGTITEPVAEEVTVDNMIDMDNGKVHVTN